MHVGEPSCHGDNGVISANQQSNRVPYELNNYITLDHTVSHVFSIVSVPRVDTTLHYTVLIVILIVVY